MKRNLLSWIVMSALAVVPVAAIGCGDDDGGGGGGGGVGGGAGSGVGGGAGGGNGVSACVDDLQESSPDTSDACATCLCTDCDSELAACDADTGVDGGQSCQDEVDCAQALVANGTCEGSVAGAACLTEMCDFELADPSGALLLCTNTMCSSECVPASDGGV
jgi:hypothetical protein